MAWENYSLTGITTGTVSNTSYWITVPYQSQTEWRNISGMLYQATITMKSNGTINPLTVGFIYGDEKCGIKIAEYLPNGQGPSGRGYIKVIFYLNNQNVGECANQVFGDSSVTNCGYSVMCGIDETNKVGTIFVLYYEGYGGRCFSTSMINNTDGYNFAKRILTSISNGGGATHIAKRTGQLKDLSSYTSDILMVSGGGGGGMLVGETAYTGKEAGGISGSGDNSADQSTGNAFGQGESGTDVSGGGSGLYGGYKGALRDKRQTLEEITNKDFSSYTTLNLTEYYEFPYSQADGNMLYWWNHSGQGSGVPISYDSSDGYFNVPSDRTETDFAIPLPARKKVTKVTFDCGCWDSPTQWTAMWVMFSDTVDEFSTSKFWLNNRVSSMTINIPNLYTYYSFEITVNDEIDYILFGYGDGNFRFKNFKVYYDEQEYIAGGAGSGYIGNSLLSNKKMVGYNVPTSSAESTKTESVSQASATPTPNVPKIGNGFTRVKLLNELPTLLVQGIDPLVHTDTTGIRKLDLTIPDADLYNKFLSYDSETGRFTVLRSFYAFIKGSVETSTDGTIYLRSYGQTRVNGTAILSYDSDVTPHATASASTYRQMEVGDLIDEYVPRTDGFPKLGIEITIAVQDNS